LHKSGATAANKRCSHAPYPESVRALAPGDDKRTGELLGLTKTEDIVDAHLALAIEDGDRVLTSDPDDLAHLLEARGVDAQVVVT
jgi:hypothetical protein